MRKSVRIIGIILFAVVLCLDSIVVYSAPAAGTGKVTVKTPAKTAVKKTAVVEEKPVEEEPSDFQTNIGNLITIGGGYYMPLGEMGQYLKPAWSVKLTYQDNQRGESPIGLGADFIYSYPPDKEVNGGMMIITAAPHISLIIPIFGEADFQFKAGPGITVLTAMLDSGKKASGDMTLHCGANVSRVFAGVFYIGIGSDFYYIFERKNLRTLNSWFSTGYRW